MASCVFGAGANELAEASIVASTKVRMTTAATMAGPARHGGRPVGAVSTLNFTRGISWIRAALANYGGFQATDKEVEQVISEATHNADRRISYDVFKRVMISH